MRHFVAAVAHVVAQFHGADQVFLHLGEMPAHADGGIAVGDPPHDRPDDPPNHAGQEEGRDDHQRHLPHGRRQAEEAVGRHRQADGRHHQAQRQKEPALEIDSLPAAPISVQHAAQNTRQWRGVRSCHASPLLLRMNQAAPSKTVRIV
jgi:hypothetical protein